MAGDNELRNIAIADTASCILNEEVSISTPLGEQVYLISPGESGNGGGDYTFLGINFGLARER